MRFSLSYFSKKIKASLFIVQKKKKNPPKPTKETNKKNQPQNKKSLKLFSTMSRVDNIEWML